MSVPPAGMENLDLKLLLMEFRLQLLMLYNSRSTAGLSSSEVPQASSLITGTNIVTAAVGTAETLLVKVEAISNPAYGY
jgi:hypothetical protein